MGDVVVQGHPRVATLLYGTQSVSHGQPNGQARIHLVGPLRIRGFGYQSKHVSFHLIPHNRSDGRDIENILNAISWTGVTWAGPTRPVDMTSDDSPLDFALSQRVLAEAGLTDLPPGPEPKVARALWAVDAALERHPARRQRLHSARSLAIIGLVAAGADLGRLREEAMVGINALNVGPHPPAIAGLLRSAGASLGRIRLRTVRDRVAPLLATDPRLVWEHDPAKVRERVGAMERRWKPALKRFEAALDRIELSLPLVVGDRVVVDRSPPGFERDLARRLHERYRRPVQVAGVPWGGWTLVPSGRLALADIHERQARAIDLEGPFGPGNPPPLWIVPADGLREVRPLKTSHVKASLDGVDVVWRGGRRYMDRLNQANELLAEVRMTQWQGIERPQLVVRDAR